MDKMIIWRLESDVNNFDNLTFTNEEDWQNFQFEYEFNGKPLNGLWKALEVQVIEKIKDSDAPGLATNAPVFSEKAIRLLNDYLKEDVEILPLDIEGGEYYILNVTNVIECIDREKSDFKTFSNSSKIMRFNKYEFIESRIYGQHIFKIAEQPKSYPFISDFLKRKIESSGLVGFKFTKVWDNKL